MKVKGKSIVEVEIDQNEAKRIMVRTLRDIFEWPDEAYIDNDGYLVVEHIAYTTHSFTDKIEYIRKATKEDLALKTILLSI